MIAGGVLCAFGAFVWGLRPDNGAVVWKRDDIGPLGTQPSAVRDTVYILAPSVASTDLYALRASTGAQLWSTGFEGSPDSVTIAGGVAYVGGLFGSLHALRTGDGSTIWSSSVNGYSVQVGGVTSGVVGVTGFAPDQIYGVRAADGKVLWTRPGGVPPAATGVGLGPLAAGGVLYAGTETGAVLALRASDGHVLWSYPTGNPGQALAIADGIVYCGGGSVLAALDASHGTLRWSTSVNGTPAVASVSDGVVYLGTSEAYNHGDFYAIRVRDGSVAWHYAAGTATGPIAAANGTAYVGSGDGNLYALRMTA